jgi:hypothetical protein
VVDGETRKMLDGYTKKLRKIHGRPLPPVAAVLVPIDRFWANRLYAKAFLINMPSARQR